MDGIVIINSTSNGLYIPIPTPLQILKLKMNAITSRGYTKDKDDVLWLMHAHGSRLTGLKQQLTSVMAGEAILRFPILEQYFLRLGFDVSTCRKEAQAKREGAPNVSEAEHINGLNLIDRMATAGRQGLNSTREPVPTGQTVQDGLQRIKQQANAAMLQSIPQVRAEINADGAVHYSCIQEYLGLLRTYWEWKGLEKQGVEAPVGYEAIKDKQRKTLEKDAAKRKSFFRDIEKRFGIGA
ncbi:hypothetical protein MBLNU230_g3167t1 [Neophaeotheca triangularis]